ncbi:DMT family transporter [Zavarzinia sp. CC-PAN008]|uniref:DMT family transporter n=1 Tax=Zavarzinia sp. CC-PAN008 TaxID=3243332 RepID=UPI003F743119
MTPAQEADRRRSLRGIALMTVAMLSIPIVDGTAKHLAQSYSPLFLSWARYAIASCVVVPLSAWRNCGSPFPRDNLGGHVARTAFLIIAMGFYFSALPLIPWTTVASAYFVAPVVAVLLAVPLLKEALTPVKGLSLALGLGGALVILRPGGHFDPAILLAFAAGIFFALYMISTRMGALTTDPVQMLAFQSVCGALLLTPFAVLYWQTPTWADAPAFLALGTISAISHQLSIAAFRFAPASTLAPLVYLELLGVTVFGLVVFGEVPDLATVVGAALIVGAGLILLRR